MTTFTVQLLSICLVYIVVAIVCLVPVVVLYILFGAINYFGLEGALKGVIGSGPIAAYVFLYRYSLIRILDLMKLGGALLEEKKARELEEVDTQTTNLPIEIPRVEGSWIGIWSWTDETTNEKTIYEETAEIEQHGREIKGTIKDESGQESVFRGSIFAHMVTFHYVSMKASRLSCGSVTVKVSADGDSMNGHQIYYDLELEKLVSTVYNLKPKSQR